MGIWVNGVQNVSSAKATAHLKGEVRDIDPGTLIQYNSVTDSASSPFLANFVVNSTNRSFQIYDGDNWDLVIHESFSDDKQSITVTRNYGEYKLIIDDRGVVIEDVSKNEYALAHNGQSKPYYKFFIVDGHLTLEASGTLQ